MKTLWDVSGELSRRMTNIFLRDEKGHRPVFGNLEKFQTDPHWRDLILFHEYFHGDSGSGVGASHQTGWTGVVTKLMQQSGEFRERKKTEPEAATVPASGSGVRRRLYTYTDLHRAGTIPQLHGESETSYDSVETGNMW
jgi:hypothetical protein